MGTRCQIKILDSGIAIYKHLDSYPDNITGIVEDVLGDYPYLWSRVYDPGYFAIRFIEGFIKASGISEEATGLGIYREEDIPGDLSYIYSLEYDNKNKQLVLYWADGDNGGSYPTDGDHIVISMNRDFDREVPRVEGF